MVSPDFPEHGGLAGTCIGRTARDTAERPPWCRVRLALDACVSQDAMPPRWSLGSAHGVAGLRRQHRAFTAPRRGSGAPPRPWVTGRTARSRLPALGVWDLTDLSPRTLSQLL